MKQNESIWFCGQRRCGSNLPLGSLGNLKLLDIADRVEKRYPFFSCHVSFGVTWKKRHFKCWSSLGKGQLAKKREVMGVPLSVKRIQGNWTKQNENIDNFIKRITWLQHMPFKSFVIALLTFNSDVRSFKNTLKSLFLKHKFHEIPIKRM